MAQMRTGPPHAAAVEMANKLRREGYADHVLADEINAYTLDGRDESVWGVRELRVELQKAYQRAFGVELDATENQRLFGLVEVVEMESML